MKNDGKIKLREFNFGTEKVLTREQLKKYLVVSLEVVPEQLYVQFHGIAIILYLLELHGGIVIYV